MKILLASSGGIGCWFLLRLMREGHECDWFLIDPEPRQNLTLKGLIPTPLKEMPDPEPYDLCIFDCTGNEDLAEEIAKVTPVIGDSALASKLEDDRLFGIQIMESCGIEVPPYATFTDTEQAKKFLAENQKRYVYKPFVVNGEEQDCATTYVSESAEDLICSLDSLCEASGNAPFLLQEVVEGTEISTEAYFDGSRFWFMNHTLEEKKFMSGGYGPNTGCYSEDTEILTADGWRRHTDLSVGQRVATINPTSGTMEYQPVQKIWQYAWHGAACHFKNKTLDILVTPDHRMIYGSGGELKAVHADTAMKLNDSRAYIPRKSTWYGKERHTFVLPSPRDRQWRAGHGALRKWSPEPVKLPMDDWLAFLGLFLSEGFCRKNSVGIAQTKPAPYMQAVIDQLPFKSCKTKKGWEISSTQLADYLRQFGKAHEKFVPRDIMQLPSRQLRILLRSLVEGDGNVHNGQISYYTCSRQLADDVQEILQKTGSEGIIRIRNRVGQTVKCNSPGITRHLSYEVIERRKRHSSLRKLKREWESYSGIMWCVTVPNGTVYVRRNGNAAWCGNCSGNLVWAINGPNRLFQNGLAKMQPFLKDAGYRGMIDLNTIVNEQHAYGLEWTPRFGYDSSASIFSLLDGDLGKFLFDIVSAPDGGCQEDPVPPLRGMWAASERLTIPPYPQEDAEFAEGIPIKGISVNDAWLECYLWDAMKSEDGLVTAGTNGIVCCPIASAFTPEGAWKGLRRAAKPIKIPNMQCRDDLEEATLKRLQELREMGWL